MNRPCGLLGRISPVGVIGHGRFAAVIGGLHRHRRTAAFVINSEFKSTPITEVVPWLQPGHPPSSGCSRVGMVSGGIPALE